MIFIIDEVSCEIRRPHDSDCPKGIFLILSIVSMLLIYKLLTVMLCQKDTIFIVIT